MKIATKAHYTGLLHNDLRTTNQHKKSFKKFKFNHLARFLTRFSQCTQIYKLGELVLSPQHIILWRGLQLHYEKTRQSVLEPSTWKIFDFRIFSVIYMLYPIFVPSFESPCLVEVRNTFDDTRVSDIFGVFLVRFSLA